ncbi:MAG: Flp pilus assembly complex ATPase component TadA [Deltaproteobacteria bacterium]|nr:Flp pilus assembly complex ATPase component TadA [Deltaproteobacteria bacterium]
MPVKSYKKLKFGEWAIKLGFMTNEQLDHILSKQNITKQRLGYLCIQEGIIDEEKLAQIIAAQCSCPYVQLEDPPEFDLFEQIPFDLMTQHQFVPYKQKDGNLFIALSEPGNFIDLVDRLEMLIDMEISIAIASSQKIREILKNFEVSQSMFDTVSDDMRLPLVKQSGQGEDILSFEKVSTEESQIVRIVDSTILDAINKQASDIHIEASDLGLIIRYRIDGMLHQATDPLDIQHLNPIISRIKVMSELDISEKRIPQDGRFKLKVMDRYIDFRVSILPAIDGENAVIRILDRNHLEADAGEFKLEGMGLPQKEIARLKRLIKAPYGMFLMTGPTGSGKTTTLYRALSEVNSKDVKIITIEDPVEYQLKGIMQIPVNIKKGLTFARGLRSILRHDPDKILVGEIRDTETAQIALQSALTGHLVFTTVHANSSFEVINRFTHMGVKPYNLMAALNCIVAQRLVRTLCACKTEITLTDDVMIESAINPAKYRGKTFYKATGCELCKGTGYKGRKAIVEIVDLNDDMKEMFIKKSSTTELKKMAVESGTTFLRKAALKEVVKGETTLEEANRVTFVELSAA